MRIFCDAEKDRTSWVVLADWFGTERVVHREYGQHAVYYCLDWVKKQEEDGVIESDLPEVKSAKSRFFDDF